MLMLAQAASDTQAATPNTLEDGINLVGKFVEWISQPQTYISLIAVVLILVIGKIVISIVCSSLAKSLRKTGRVSELLINFTVNIIGKLCWVLVIIVALGQLGISVGPLIAGLGVTGFIIGFAFQETLGNLAAGFMIALNQPFQEGHVVEIGGTLGKVIDMNMMCVTMYTGDNKKITVPNNAVWGAAITNYSALDTRRVDMTVGVSYGADLSKTKEVVLAAITAIPEVLAEPAPTIEVTEMADSSVNFVVRPWVNTADYWTVFWAAQKGMKEALDEAGIEIPFPQMDLHLPDGLPPAAPASQN